MNRAFIPGLLLVGVMNYSTPLTAQQAVSLRQVLVVDSQWVRQPSLSPDGKWVVWSAQSTTGAGQRLWIASTAGGKPFPLTSEGHGDQVPRWFPGGDRIVFVSTRPNRNGRPDRFAMVLGVNRETGKPVGAPQQATVEPTAGATASPDGRWLAYTTRSDKVRVKLIPVNGGTARVLAEFDGPDFMGLSFDRSGANVYLLVQGSTDGSMSGKLWRIPVNGGRREVVAEGEQDALILPNDPRFVMRMDVPRLAHLGPGSATLVGVDGREVAKVNVPRFMFVNPVSAYGWGFTAWSNRSQGTVKVVSVADGSARTLITGDNWPEAWTPDGSALITDLPDGQGNDYILQLLPVAGGGTVQTVRLPPGPFVGSWSTSVGPFFSYRKQNSKAHRPGEVSSLYSFDLRNGASTLLSAASPGDVWIGGRGGFENDGDRWVYAEREDGRLVIKSADPATGQARTLRDYPTPPAGVTRPNVQIHGNKVAWLETKGDSVHLMYAEGRGTARLLASFRLGRERSTPAMAWSWSGREIAVAPESHANPGAITILGVPDNEGRSARREVTVEVNYCCDYLQWLPDDSAILTLVSRVSGPNASLLLVPARGGGTPRVLADDVTDWEFLMSPDGKHVAYTASRSGSTTIWVADFRSVIPGQ